MSRCHYCDNRSKSQLTKTEKIIKIVGSSLLFSGLSWLLFDAFLYNPSLAAGIAVVFGLCLYIWSTR